MKKLLLILIVVSSGYFNEIFSWDSTAAKYLPLQVGNTWVYRGEARSGFMVGRSYTTYKINGILDTLGKKYYTLETRIIIISGTIPSGIWQFGSPIRIDSVTMNVYKLQAYCNSNEWLMDSLRARKFDTTKICPLQFYYANSYCFDTSLYNIFGNNYQSKRFTEFFGPGYSAVYVKGIGIAYGTYGYSMNQSYDSLKGCVINGVLYGDTSILVGINQLSNEVPKHFSLSQNYPNPFNPATNIKFQIPHAGFVKLIIFDLLGREIQTLVNEQLSAGTYEADFDGGSLPSGVYYYRLEAEDPSTPLRVTETKKMVLIK